MSDRLQELRWKWRLLILEWLQFIGAMVLHLSGGEEYKRLSDKTAALREEIEK